MRRWVLGLVLCAGALMWGFLPLGAQDAEDPPFVVADLPVGDCFGDAAMAAGKVVVSCDSTGGSPAGLLVASPSADGATWGVQENAVEVERRSDVVGVRSSVGFVRADGGFGIMNIGSSVASFDEIDLPGDIAGAIGAGLSSLGRERFVVPFPVSTEFDGVEFAVVTKLADGPAGPGGPTAGGWGVELFQIPTLSGVAATAVLGDHVYVASNFRLIEVDVVSGVQKLVFEPQGVDSILDVVSDVANGRVLVFSFPSIAFISASPAHQLDLGSVVDGAHPLVELNFALYGHVQTRSSNESVLFSQVFGQMKSVDFLSDGTYEAFDFGDGSLSGRSAGVGERVAFLTQNDTLRVYDLTGWVAPQIGVEALPSPAVVESVLLSDATVSEPYCVAQVETSAGYCFGAIADRETYIIGQLLGRPVLGTIWIGRFDEEAVAP